MSAYRPPEDERRLSVLRRRYRLLLRAWPREFREHFGADMTETFVRHVERERGRLGAWGVVWAWIVAIKDALTEGLVGRIREHGKGRGRGVDWMGDFMGDVRFSLRSLLRRPVLSITAVVTLALGIGANAAVFSVVNGIVLKPLEYENPEELVFIYASHQERGWNDVDMNVADAWDIRARAGVFQDLAAYQERSRNLTGGDVPEVVTTVVSTPNMFDVLRVQPRLGRGFSAEDGREGAEPVVLLGDGFWQRRFAGDPSVVGSTLVLDGTVATVIGILPESFDFVESNPDLYTVLRTDPTTVTRNSHNHEVIARLTAGTEVATADAAVRDVMRQLEDELPESNRGWSADVTSIREKVAGDGTFAISAVLMTTVGLVLLMACVNVANLLLARADSRKAELAVRAALGAGRGRILRQLMTESLVLAGLGGAAGALVAVYGNRWIVASLPGNVPEILDFSLDWRVVAFTAAVSVGSAMLFGFAPAWRATKGGTSELRSGSRGSRGRGRARFGSSLAIVQTALAVALLVSGGIMTKSVIAMVSHDYGWEAEGVLTARVTPPASKYEDAEAYQPFHDRVMERVAAVPGVEAVGAIHTLPLEGSNWSSTVERADVADPVDLPIRVSYVSHGYFEAMELSMVAGRSILPSDTEDSPNVVVVNEAFVQRYLSDIEPVGARLHWGEGVYSDIVGVVEDHYERRIDRAVGPNTYEPLAQNPIRGRYIVARTSGDPVAFADPVRQAVLDVDPDQPLETVVPMMSVLERRLGSYRLIAQLMGAFAVVSLLLGAVGIYGVTAFAVGQRFHEIGIRMAMGADRGSVRGMVLGQGMRRAVIGLLLGIGLALPLTRVMSGFLVGVSPTDPFTFVAVTVTIMLVAGLGCYLPARRASTVDPVRALSAE